MRGSRPPWYRTARSIGGAPWVPFEVARALQEQLDAHRQRLQQCEREIQEARTSMQRLARQAEDRLAGALADAERAQLEAEQAREQARAAAERPAECEPAPSDEAGRLRRLSEDLARVRGRTEHDVASARRDERAKGLLRLVAVHDDLRRGLEALPQDPDSPWFQGYQAILMQLEQQLAQAGATRFGAVGDPFDPALHEAVGTAPGQIDHLVGLLEPGFALADDRLLRPARVVVGSGA